MPVTVEQDGGAVVVKIPMAIKKRLGRKEVIVPEGLDGAPKPAAQEPLITALARAFWWQELIDTGKYPSIAELAAALGVDRCYARRILSLACLAPDIVEAIVAGREPSGLSLEKLVKSLPMEWDEQSRMLRLCAES
jgi:hypothetical protein